MSESTISLQGYGSIHVVPDVTRIEVTISNHFSDYKKAYSQGAENTSWISRILEYNNKPASLAKNIRFDVSEHRVPIYDDDDHILEYEVKGYDLIQKIRIDLPIDNILVNNIIRGIGKYIPGAEVSVSYTLLDMRPVQLKLLALAVSDAREKADIMANAVGCKLGKVLSIEYGRADVTVMSQTRQIHSNDEAKASTASSLDITPDDLIMSDTATLVFELINP
ncbi:MAG: SIMPL domain-containing protein [Candidatus Amulumruptor caecigallinarius]|nr:SIMPL domain-containing protein [Candidatus Amulumruptor caecigallinarius]